MEKAKLIMLHLAWVLVACVIAVEVSINASELKDVDEEMLEDFFRIIDADGSGDIEYEEFVRAAVDKKKFLDDTILKFAFDFFDKDKSGKITLEEVKEIFQQNKEFPEQDFQMIIDQVDNNSDGMIDFNEFKEMMTNILN